MIALAEQDRHPIVNHGRRLVGVGREDGTGANRCTVFRDPTVHFPQSRHRQDAAIFRFDQKGLLAIGHFFPLVVAVRRNQTATRRERVPERWFGVDRFTTGIDHPIPDSQIFRPRGHQSPAGLDWGSWLAGRLAEDADDGLRRRDVVPRRFLKRELFGIQLWQQQLAPLGRGRSESESTTQMKTRYCKTRTEGPVSNRGTCRKVATQNRTPIVNAQREKTVSESGRASSTMHLSASNETDADHDFVAYSGENGKRRSVAASSHRPPSGRKLPSGELEKSRPGKL